MWRHFAACQCRVDSYQNFEIPCGVHLYKPCAASSLVSRPLLLSQLIQPATLYTSSYQRKMQLRHSIYAILLLTLSGVAFATLEHMADVQRMTSSGITKRADAVSERLLGGCLLESQSLEKRQSVCPVSGYSPCPKDKDVCCKFSLFVLIFFNKLVNNSSTGRSHWG